MSQLIHPVSMAIPICVTDMEVALAWYRRLFGRPPDIDTGTGIKEWEVISGTWFQLLEGTPAPDRLPIRIGVPDIKTARRAVQEALQIEVSEIERIEKLAAWCDFSDPFGNRLGFFQDLRV